MSMDAHASMPQGYKDAPTNFRNPYQSQPFFQPMNPPTGIYLGSTVSQNLSYGPMYQGFFPNHPGSQVGYQNPPSFMFRERKGKVNWRNIASLDVDEMVGKGDIRTLESYLSNICFANIEEEDVERIGDVNLLKLFRLSQYSLEYLLNCQNYLAHQSQALEYQYKLSDEQLHPLEEQVKKNHAEILRLKNDIGEHKGLLASYQNTLSTPMYKCHLCSKIFKSQDFLNTHFQNRHPDAFQSKNKNKVESSVQTQNPQQDNVAVIEKLMIQLKENENAKLSQMTSTLQARLQEVIQSNKELTEKVAEMEKKIGQEGEAGSPDQPFNRTIRRGNPTIETGESLNEIQSKQTPKKTERTATSETPSKQVFRAGDLEADEETQKQRNQQQKFNAGSLKDIEEEHSVKREGQQKFNAGSLKDVEDDEKSQRQGKQAFNAGSLKDIDDEEEGEIRQSGSIEIKQTGSSEIKHTANRIQDQKSYTKQAFNSGSLKDLEDDEEVEVKKRASRTSIEKKQTFNAGSVQDNDTEEAKTQGSLKEIKNVDGTKPYKRQTFYAGELESDTTRTKAKDVQEYRAGELEDDKESVGGKSRKRSQEDMVIMEEHEEEEADERRKGSYDREVRRQTEEKDEDEIREAHKNAVIKATNLIRNKYQHPITQDDYDKAHEQVQKDLKRKSKDLLKTEYTELKDQNLNELHVMQNKLTNLNKNNMIQFDRLEREFFEQTSEPVHQPNGQERRSQDAPNKNNKVAQSSELMNLVVDPERKGKDLKASVDSDAAKKKQIFEPQSNLTKKNIQSGEAEYL